MVIVPGCVMLVTSRRRLCPAARTTRDELQALAAQIDEAVDAGVDLVQIRESDAAARPLVACVEAAVRRSAGTRTAIVVNDRADVAAAARAAGVHLPARGMPTGRVKALGGGWCVGRSTHDADEPGADAAADYWLFGTVFPTASKPGVTGAGLTALRAAVHAASAPVLAIGGIDPERAAACAAAGAGGVAAIGAFLPRGAEPGALGVAAAARAFREAFGRIC